MLEINYTEFLLLRDGERYLYKIPLQLSPSDISQYATANKGIIPWHTTYTETVKLTNFQIMNALPIERVKLA